ncbi:MAG: sensor histidine kinase [Actinomycetota bacterium]|nr:sensor histidine kinase [Actinomycetota bacterium]
MTALRRFPAWVAYLTLGLLAVVLDQLLPHLAALSSWPYYVGVYLAINVSSVLALAGGIARYRPRGYAWYLILANQVVYLGGDFFFYVGRDAWHWTFYPAPADAFYLSHYPLLAAGLVVLTRARNTSKGFEDLFDSAIAGVGFGVLSWLFLIAPSAQSAGPLLAKVVSVAYPVSDLIVALVALRLLVGGGLRLASFRILLGALALLFATDSIYVWMQLNGTYHDNRFLDVMWLCYYLVLGASALHPSMRATVEPAQPSRPSKGRFVVLGALTLVVPIFGLVDSYLRSGKASVVVDWGSLVLFLLVSARMLSLISRQRSLLAANEAQSVDLSAALAQAREAQEDRAKLLSRTVLVAERERARVAADLHDGPIQHLASSAYAIDSALLRLERGQADLAAASLARVRESLADEVGSLRRMMSELRPPVLDQGGLVPALRDYVAAFSRRSGTSVELTPELGEVDLPDELETVLYRLVQEALTNVERHSGARSVQLRLTRLWGDLVELSVRDDGVGFEPGHLTELLRAGHFGVAGMRERVEAAGGKWRLTSAPGKGTELKATIPMAGPVPPWGRAVPVPVPVPEPVHA